MTLADSVPSNVQQQTLHAFRWMDISTPQYARSTEFYAGLFDWTFDELDPQFHYATAYRGGNKVAGFSDFAQPTQPTQWMGYLLVEDAAALGARAAELGGAMDMLIPVGDLGTMAVLTDPSGAKIGLWQPAKHQGAELIMEPGSLSWVDYRTREPQIAIDFYTQLFGWTATKADFPGMEYWTFELDGRPHAGLHVPSEDQGEITPGWSYTIGVEDADVAVEWVSSHDGTVLSGPTDTAFGRVVTILDPDGARLSLMQPPADGWGQ
jgi:predicted enzyme related to lactoylglutathione lyase